MLASNESDARSGSGSRSEGDCNSSSQGQKLTERPQVSLRKVVRRLADVRFLVPSSGQGTTGTACITVEHFNTFCSDVDMAAPVLVREYTIDRIPTMRSRNSNTKALPAVSSYAFVDILRAADGPEFQSAIDGIAEICAKNRLSLADEYASHMPPLGTITAASSASVRPQAMRPGMRRALTSVPEASSGSSEGSQKSLKKRGGLFSFKRQKVEEVNAVRTIRIGTMGRTISVGCTTALATAPDVPRITIEDTDEPDAQSSVRKPSLATSSLQRLLNRSNHLEPT